MLETMYDANGIGLAATQIAIDKRLIVMDCGEVDFETENLTENISSSINKSSPILAQPFLQATFWAAKLPGLV